MADIKLSKSNTAVLWEITVFQSNSMKFTQFWKHFFSTFKCRILRSSSLNYFNRGHATLHLAVSVHRSVHRFVGPSVHIIFEFRAVSALLLLPNRSRLDFRVSGLVLFRSYKQSKLMGHPSLDTLLKKIEIPIFLTMYFHLSNMWATRKNKKQKNLLEIFFAFFSL